MMGVTALIATVNWAVVRTGKVGASCGTPALCRWPDCTDLLLVGTGLGGCFDGFMFVDRILGSGNQISVLARKVNL